MSREPFDDLDRVLKIGMAALAPDVPAADDALRALWPGFRRARRRARAVRAGGVLCALLLLGAAAAAASPGSPRSRVHVLSPSTLAATTTTPGRTPTSAARSSTTVTSAPTSTTSTTTSPGPADPVRSLRPRTGAPVPTTRPGLLAVSGATRVTVPARLTHRYVSRGGSITIGLSRGSLDLLRISPAPGFEREVSARGPGRVAVRFTRAGADFRIVVEAHNGRIVRASEDGNSGH